MHNVAYHLFEQGRHAEAERMYRKILQRNPQDEVANNAFAFLLRHTGRTNEAIELLRRCLKNHPESVHLLLHLGESYREVGRLEEASLAYRKVLRLRSNSAEALFCLGLVLQSQDQQAEARSLLEKALKINPQLAEAHNSLATILVETEQYDAAISHYLEAIRINPRYFEAHVNLANILKDEKNNLELALKHFEIATSLQPNFLESYYSIGQAWFELDEVERAAACYEKALSMRKDYPEVLTALGYCRLVLGDAVQARRLYERALELSPNFAGALFGLTQTQKFSRHDDPLAQRMQNLLQDQTLEDTSRADLHFGLGKLYDDCSEFELAFEHYHEGNCLRQRQRVYDRVAREQGIDQICSIFDTQWFEHTKGWGNPTEVPIFIIGMPRSGTTLTEQILAAHPAVFGAGELHYFARLRPRLFPGSDSMQPLMHMLRNIGKEEFLAIGEGYLNKTSEIAKQPYQRITDKMPHNFLWLGLIASLFPNAKIIHCRRDALDNGLSIYFQNFTSGHEYSFDLGNIGHEYRQYQRMMRYWHEVLPSQILELDYESTTDDPEGTARHIVAFCGLQWDDACLSPQKADRAIMTASVFQVRQPIYNTSVARWKHYEQHLGPLKAALGLG